MVGSFKLAKDTLVVTEVWEIFAGAGILQEKLPLKSNSRVNTRERLLWGEKSRIESIEKGENLKACQRMYVIIRENSHNQKWRTGRPINQHQRQLSSHPKSKAQISTLGFRKLAVLKDGHGALTLVPGMPTFVTL